ncbi:hypothetical protein DN062_15280 [Nitrincola tibetensis]|uniref:Uncharacterized protein n=1 Tax=Nitrincola tibetensis TaxID=2219697 RepID=A0A364NJ45_9GAMM|nr:hypothetical protein DN062_15280 [Nitrincola tibetensis]
MSKIKSPQEKKELSYSRDRRNCYGESDKGSRKTIKKKKRSSEHAQRSKLQKLKSLGGSAINEDLAIVAESEFINSTKSSRLRGFRKYPDQSLKDHVNVQATKRIIRHGRKKNS